MKQPDWQGVPWNKQINPPSIPSHNYVFGYEEENGELVRQKNTEKVHTGTKSDTVGPGEYEIARTIGQSRKGVRWVPPKHGKKPTLASMATRNSTAAVASSTVETPGPGHYLAESKDVVPIYKYKQSSVFASKVDRQGGRMRNSEMVTTHSTQLGKGKTAYGVKSTNPTSPGSKDEEDDDDYYEEEDDGVTPGPGAYFNPQTSTTFKVK